MSETQYGDMYRSQWMKTEGRQVYDDWMTLLLEAATSTSLAEKRDMYDFSDDMPASHNLLQLARRERSKLIAVDDNLLRQSDQHPVLDHVEAVGHYTTLSELSSAEHAHQVGVHDSDTLEFAINTTLGLAYQASEQISSSSAHPHRDTLTYRTIANILRNPSFHESVNSFARTGFASLQLAQTTSRDLYEGVGLPVSTANSLHLPPHIDLFKVTGHSARTHFALNPRLKGGLRGVLRTQNAQGIDASLSKGLSELGSPISIGCPVAYTAAGEDKTAIAKLSDYLALQVERELVAGATYHTLGSAAIQDVHTK